MKQILPFIVAFVTACHPCSAGTPQLQIRTGHGASVDSIAFTPDGKTLASAGYDQTIRLWDATSGKEINNLVGHQGVITSLSLSSDGSQLASTACDGTIKLWAMSDGHLIRTIEPGYSSLFTAFSPDGKTLASCTSESLYLWDSQSGEQLKHLLPQSVSSDPNSDQLINSIAFSPDGKIVAAAKQGGGANLWATASGKAMPPVQTKSKMATAVAFSADGKTAIGTASGAVELFELASGRRLLSTSVINGWIHGLAFSRDGKQFAAGGNGKSIKLYDTSTGRALRTFLVSSGISGSLAFSPDTKTLAAADCSSIRFWRLDSGKEIQRTNIQANGGETVCTPDGKSLTTIQGNHGFRIWALAPGAQSRILATPGRTGSANLSPDGKRLASVRSVRQSPYLYLDTIHVLDTQSGRELQTLNLINSHSVSWSPDSRTLAAIGAGALKLYDATSGKELHSIAGCESYAWCPIRTALAVGTENGTIEIWDGDVPSLRKSRSFIAYPARLTITGHQMPNRGKASLIAWSPDGKTLASECSGEIKLWDMQAGSLSKVLNSTGRTELRNATPPGQSAFQIMQSLLSPNTLQQHGLAPLCDQLCLLGATIQNPGPGYGFISVTCMKFSPDGKTLALTELDNSIRLWDVGSGKVRKTLRGHTAYVYSLSFTPNGKMLISSGADSTSRLWDTNSGNELARLFSYGDDDWLVTTPDGHFDASPGAMRMIYWRDGSHVIETDQLKQQFLVPDLLRKTVSTH